MNKFVFILLVLNILSSCSLVKSRQVPETLEVNKASQKKYSVTPLSKWTKGTKAVWHLVEPMGLELVVRSVDKTKRESITIDKTLSQVEMDPGDWQIIGFKLEGKQFETITAAKYFGFKLIPLKDSYAGSIIVGCPMVGEKHLPQMKKMKFFNRFTFKSGNSLCEMVVGNEYPTVKRVWTKLTGQKAGMLTMGF